MLSTCPECQTSFRIAQAQLDSRRGLVRCGRCNAVFNAYDTLLPELQTPPAAEPEPPAAAAPPPAAEFAPAPASESAPAPMPEVEVESWLRAERPTLPELELPPEEKTPQEQTPSRQPSPKEQDSAQPAQESAEDILLTELFKRKEHPPAGKAWLWGPVALLLFLTLGGQLAYFFRADLAAHLPEARPWLEQTCRTLGCTIPLPQDSEALRIEASSLETDPENKSRAILRLSLSNRSEQAVAWPHLILLLTDVNDTPLAQRPFMPVEYLPPRSDPSQGIHPTQEQEINLELEIRGLSAYGYKMEKRYP